MRGLGAQFIFELHLVLINTHVSLR